MLRISRLTDYGTLVLAHLPSDTAQRLSAADVAAATGINLPTVSKLLKLLGKADPGKLYCLIAHPHQQSDWPT